MITMRLLALCLLLCAAPAWGGVEEGGLAEQKSSVRKLAEVLQQSLAKPSVLEEKLVAQGEEVPANVSYTTGVPVASPQKLLDVSKEESTLHDDEGNAIAVLQEGKERMPLTQAEKPLVQEEKVKSPSREDDAEEVKPLTQDEEKTGKQLTKVKEVVNSPSQDKKAKDEVKIADQKYVKPLTQADEVVKSLTQYEEEEINLPTQVKKVEVLILDDDKEQEVVRPTTQDEQDKSLTQDEENDEEAAKSPNQDEDEEDTKPLSQDEDEEEDTNPVTKDGKSLTQDEDDYNQKVKPPNQEEGNSQEKPEGKLPNLSNIPKNDSNLQVDFDITSILQDDDDDTVSKLREEEDTMLISENGEDTTSKSQEDDDATLLIFQEDDDSIPSLQEDDTVLILQEAKDVTDPSLLEDEEDASDQQDDNTMLILQEQDDGTEPSLWEDDDTMSEQQDEDLIIEDDVENERSQGNASANKDRNSSRFLSKEGSESSHFYAYLVATAIIVIVLYAVYHNNRKIINCVMERRSKDGWRPAGADYQSLDNKV